nr:MAG: hypothetical protein [Bacteriophage sp.]
MYRYAQITDSGYVVGDSYLSGEVDYPNMIPISDDFDLTNKRYVDGKWEEYTPAPPPDPEPSELDKLKARVTEIENGQNAMISGAQDVVKNESSQAHA